MATTESLSVKTGAYLDAESSYAQAQYMDRMPGVGIENTNEYMYSMVSYGYISYGFDVSAIPEGSVIDSVTCKAKAKRMSSGTTGILQLYSGTTAKGSATTFTDSSMATYTLNAGTWSWDEIQKIRLRITASSTQQYKYIYFYGADLTVTYTYQNEKFMLRLTPSAGDESLLPSGYTRLENIQCTGAQYADLGFKPNTNTRFVMDCQAKATNSGGVFPFGVRAGLSDRAFAAALTDSQVFYNYGSSYKFADYPNVLERMTIDANAFSAVFKGSSTVTISLTTVTFTCGSNLLVGTFSNAGTPSAGENAWNGPIWSCQAYDNGTLIRDCYPCLNPNGVPGLYDIVNGVFYGSATSAPFVAGPEYNDGWHDIARVFKKMNGIWVEQEELANVVDQTKRLVNGGEYVPPLISFTLASNVWYATQGMTWARWCESEYNNGTQGWHVASNGYVTVNTENMWVVDANGSHVKGTDAIIADHTYKITPTKPS